MKIQSKQELRLELANRTVIVITMNDKGVDMLIREPDTGYGMQEQIGRTVEVAIAADELRDFAKAMQSVASWFGLEPATVIVNNAVNVSPGAEQAIADQLRHRSSTEQ